MQATTVSFSGAVALSDNISVSGDVDIADKIIHIGDIDTAIRFPAADTITAETGGSERIRITSAGLIGVNVTPTSHNNTTALQIHDTYNSQGYPRLRLTNQSTGSTSGDGFEITLDGSNLDAIIRQRENANIHFYTNNTEKVRITADGDMGVGTSDIWARLVSREDSTNTNLTGHNYLASLSGMSIDNGSTTTGSFNAYTSRVKNASGTQQSGSIAFKSTSSGFSPEIHLTQRNGSGSQASRLTIDSSGNLKVPAGAFDLRVGDDIDSNAGTQTISVGSVSSGSGGIGIFANPTNGNSFVQFGDGTAASDQYRGYMNYQHASDKLIFGAGGANRLTITSNGRVGIHDSDPQVALHVQGGNGAVSPSSYSVIDLAIENNAEAALGIIGNSYSSIYFGDADTALQAGVVYNHSTNALELRGSGNTARLTIAAGGDVTISPAGDPILTVTGSGHAQLQLITTSGTDHCGVNFGDNDDNNAGMIQYTNSNNKMQFHTNGSEKMAITSEGYVTKPQTPSWMLRPSYNSTQTLGANEHAIGWSSSDTNTHAKAVRLHNVTLSGSGFANNLHNGQNFGKITVPVAGIYYVFCTIRMENNPVAGNLYLNVDGTRVDRQHVEMWDTEPFMHARIAHILNLQANSYIIWSVNCNTGQVSGINDKVNWTGGYLIG